MDRVDHHHAERRTAKSQVARKSGGAVEDPAIYAFSIAHLRPTRQIPDVPACVPPFAGALELINSYARQTLPPLTETGVGFQGCVIHEAWHDSWKSGFRATCCRGAQTARTAGLR
eukprot:9504065-Pyramimonas_sp.AAC.2